MALAAARLARLRSILKIADPGEVRHFSQRNERAPWSNCGGYAEAVCWWFAGLRWPLDETRWVIETWRLATGDPEYVNGKVGGTSAYGRDRAFETLFPWAFSERGVLDESDMLAGLAARELTIAIPVWGARLDAVTGLYWRDPTWSHVITLAGYRPAGKQVLHLDPLAPAGHKGRWLDYDRLARAFSTATPDGKQWGVAIRRGDLMQTLINERRVFAPNPASVAATPSPVTIYEMDDERLTLAALRSARLAAGHVDRVIDVRQAPVSGRPTGEFVRLIDGSAEGKYVRLSAVRITEHPPELPPDADAIRAAAYQAGFDARSGQLEPVTGRLYRERGAVAA